MLVVFNVVERRAKGPGRGKFDTVVKTSLPTCGQPLSSSAGDLVRACASFSALIMKDRQRPLGVDIHCVVIVHGRRHEGQESRRFVVLNDRHRLVLLTTETSY